MENNENNNIEMLNNQASEEKEFNEVNTKKNIKMVVLFSAIFLIVGMLTGFFVLKGLNKSVKENSFMYDILSKTGLLMSNSNELDNVLATDSDANTNANNLIFLTEKDNIRYFYLYDEGAYYYYYSPYGNNAYFYASDSNGKYLDSTYIETKDDAKEFYIQSFVGKTEEEAYNIFMSDNNNPYYSFNIVYVPNSEYEAGEIYYQSLKGEQTTYYDYTTLNYYSTTVTLVANPTSLETID